ncbi:MAG: PQQ-binding-like beta-propeller repeat protein, partial [Bryobacteraceae bacterium]
MSTAATADLDGDGRAALVFGTEDNEVYAVRGDGRMLWHTEVPGRVGRALPVIAELRPGEPDVLVSTPFVGRFQGLMALDAKTGASRWKAPSLLQSYESTLVADLEGDGVPEVVYGDKSTRVFCVDHEGKRQWATQLDGRGIFFAPAAARLEEHEKAVLFQVVRAAGVNGKALYLLNSDGKTLEALPLKGGGSSAPLLCRWRGGEISLLVASGPGAVTQYRLTQGPGARILAWRAPARERGATTPEPRARPAESVAAVVGTNRLSAERRGASVVSFRVIDPSGVAHVTFRKPQSAAVEATFTAAAPGDYREMTTWYSAGNSILGEERKIYRAAREEARFAAPQVAGSYGELALSLQEQVAAANGLATRSGRAGDYDAARIAGDHARALLHAVTISKARGPILIHGVPN